MKKILLITLIITTFALSSCKKDTLGVSSVVTYPSMTLAGDVAMTITVGSTYVEKGAVVKEGQTDLSKLVKISGTVNATTPGVYTLTYTYRNAGKIYPQDSLILKTRRYVGVISAASATMDISGSYMRNAGVFGIATITKTAYPGLYKNNNPGGAAVDNLFVYMFQPTPTTVTVPSQDSPAGEFACTGGVYDATGAAPKYSWVCVNAGYGAAVRTFIKQ